MTARMAALDALLADAGELLDQADTQTITESLERGEAPDHRDADRCLWCRHEFHGLPCQPSVDFLVATMQFCDPDDYVDDSALPLVHPQAALWPCNCDSALDRLDDTWRPWIGPTSTEWLMHVTGLDGWSARALFDITMAQVHAAAEKRWVSIGATTDGPDFQPVVDGIAQFVDGFAPVARQMHALTVTFTGRITAAGAALLVGIPAVPVVPTVEFHPPLIVDETRDFAPETPAARALRLRQTRHTGPARPPANRAPRPRRL